MSKIQIDLKLSGTYGKAELEGNYDLSSARYLVKGLIDTVEGISRPTLETNETDLRGVIDGVKKRTTSVNDAIEYVLYAMEQVLDIPIPEEGSPEWTEELKDYYATWSDLKAELTERWRAYKS